jgi:beta-phosphoglucomutase-like phosphatase (HAD superfamily)
VLGVPKGISACLFDLDGVLTQTAKVHAAAWRERAPRGATPVVADLDNFLEEA